jgi:hypothetical protein
MPYKIIYDCFAPNQKRFINIDMFCDDIIDGVDKMDILKKMDIISTYTFNERWIF